MEEKILRILEEVNDEILAYDGSNMVADGIISSFEIVEIISNIEEEFDIEISGKNLVAVNFANKDAIIEMVKRIM